MSEEKYLIVIGGPTASGKTAFAIALARHLQAPILSADSRQFYRELSIGTAKPDLEERSQVPHFFIDNRSIREPYSVGQFEKEALGRLADIFRSQDVALLVGGSGLYLKAVCEGMDAFPEVDEAVQTRLQSLYEEQGIEALQEKLREKDPDYYGDVDLHNPHRLLRALSVIESTGKTFSHFRKNDPEARPFTPIYLQIHLPRQQLYQRIDQRVEKMIRAGLEDEVRAVWTYRDKPALKTVGYQEWSACFEGEITRAEVIRLIQRNSRRYAKRQLTWYRRDGYWKHFRPEERQLALQYVQFIRQKGGRWETLAAGVEKERKIVFSSREAVLHFCLIQVRKDLLLHWPQADPPETEMTFLTWHEYLLRAEEWGAILLLPAGAKLWAGKAGCIPVAIERARIQSWKRHSEYLAEKTFSCWTAASPRTPDNENTAIDRPEL